ncbi:MAG: alpha/beta hydrolase [Desulfobacterales bacterium]|nr:alpha/beta hydrolase [Desulfobacterales bacterium]
MIRTSDFIRIRRRPRPGLVLVGILLLGATFTACSRSPHKINLMPAPAVFADGEINPLPAGKPPVSYDNFRMLYATDRKRSDNPETRPFYYNQAGFVVRLGHARVSAGDPGIQWEDVRRITLAKNRERDFPLQVLAVKETDTLVQTDTFIAPSPDDESLPDGNGQVFGALVDQRMGGSGHREVYVYVHGYRVVFDVPVMVAAELWHFLGYRGAFVAYTWPSTPHFLAYAADVETAIHMARKLRLFLTYLAEETQVEKIHVIGFSAGSRLVVGALEQLALMNADKSDAEIRRRVKIGNVIIVGGDVSRKGFAAAVADGLLRIPERVTVYVSSADRALIWARRIFRHQRLGQMLEKDVPPKTHDFLRHHPTLELVDVTRAAGSTTGNGHSYFSQSPWVSSDLLALLAFDLGAERRGLRRMPELPIWSFPDDYIERLQQHIKTLKPDLARGSGRRAKDSGAAN